MQLGRLIRGIVLALSFFALPQAMAVEYSGIWLDSEKVGQGVNFHHEGEQVSGAWYLYDSEGNAMWLTFIGTLDGNSLSADLLEFSGPLLGAETWDAAEVQSNKVGSVSVFFQSTSAASFFYTLDGTSSTLNLTRFGNKTQHLDGIYQGTTTTSSPSVGDVLCDTAVLGFAVVDHAAAGFALDSSGDFYTLSATVGTDGVIADGAFADGPDNLVSFGGIVNGNSGGGTWSDLTGCSGTWSATTQQDELEQ